MGIARSLQRNPKFQLHNLKMATEVPLFYLASTEGSIKLKEMRVSGRNVMVTFGFCSHGAAKAAADGYQAEWDEEVHVRNMPVGNFLAFLFSHLGQADIDILLSDDETPYPLTTMGVNVLQDPAAARALEMARQKPEQNFLLEKVARELLVAVGGKGAENAVRAAKYKTLITTITGSKRAVLPTVDLGLVWFMTVNNKGSNEVEPLFFRITAAEDQAIHEDVENLGDSVVEESLVIGPLAFSHRSAAFNWSQTLPPHVAVHLIGLEILLSAERAPLFLGQIRDQFPEYRVDDLAPDCFLLDGGVLPLTVAGAHYVESKINYKDFGMEESPKHTWATIAESDEGESKIRIMAIKLVADQLGIEIVDPNVPDQEEENLIVDPNANDDDLVQAVTQQLMAGGDLTIPSEENA